jgi:deoxycytidine triphosphate deaminase
MFLGASEIWDRINNGVLARFDKDGKQIPPSEEDLTAKNVVWFEEEKAWRWTLIQNIPDDFQIEGCTVDLRIDKVFRHRGLAKLFVDKRETGKTQEIFPRNNLLYIPAGVPILVQTMEIINMPNDLLMVPGPRTTMFRSAIMMNMTFTNPGYFGPLTFLAVNTQQMDVPVERGFRMAQVAFAEVKGSNIGYSGLWQGGKVSTDGDFAPPR